MFYNKFNMIYIKETSVIPRIVIITSKNGIYLDQSHYVKKIFKKYNFMTLNWIVHLMIQVF